MRTTSTFSTTTGTVARGLTVAAAVTAGMLAVTPDATAAEAKAAPMAQAQAPSAWPATRGLIPAAKSTSESLAIQTTRTLPSTPLDKAWASVPAFKVDLQAQQMTAPGLEAPSIAALDVQGMTDGKSIAWRLSWDDATPDGNVDTSRFSDAVAIEFPVAADAAATMGHPDGGRVQILYWKALWQKDMEVGFQDVHSLHPNVYSDLYWFASGNAPYPMAEAFKDRRSHPWLIAQSAGNPMAAVGRSQPVEELTAEGFGTLTHQPTSASSGAGAWAGNRWSVVFVRSLATTDPLDYQFQPGGTGQIGFAVWQGATGNAGGRKHWADWVPFTVPK